MGNNCIFAANKIDPLNFKKAQKLGANKIIFNTIDPTINTTNEKIEFIDANKCRIKGTWFSYKKNTSILQSLRKKCPQLFKLNQIDAEPAFRKYLFWANFKIGFLECLIDEESQKDNTILYQEPYFRGKYILEFIKYSKNYIRILWLSFKEKNKITKEFSKNIKPYGIIIKDDFELKLYENLVQKFTTEELVIFYYNKLSAEKINSLREKGYSLKNLSVIHSVQRFPFINIFVLTNEELCAINLIAQNWNNLVSEVERWRYIQGFNLKKIIVNEAENIPSHNLLQPVLKESGTKVFNTMNGIKAAQAQEGDITFDYWFVWDNEMKNLLHTHGHIPLEKLIVTGHLSEDNLRNQGYKNSLDINQDIISKKKIISVFSVRGNRKEKKDVLKALYKFVSEHDDYYILFRAHPLEKESEYVLPSENLSNFNFVKYNLENSKQTLIDQLYVSDLTIVFGSTVALESKWLNTPCITFEPRPTSMLYCVDGNIVKHVNDITHFIQILQSTPKKITQKAPLTSTINTVAEKYYEVIRNVHILSGKQGSEKAANGRF